MSTGLFAAFALAITCLSAEPVYRSIIRAGVHAHAVFPGAEWEQRAPESMGLDGEAINRVAERLGGRPYYGPIYGRRLEFSAALYANTRR